MRFLSFLLLLLWGCSPAARTRARDSAEKARLSAQVEDYWLGVRWNEASKMTVSLFEPEAQVALAKVLAQPTLRVTETQVLSVVVGPELIEMKARDRKNLTERWRTAIVLVQVQSYAIAGNRVVTESVEQSWVLDPRGWHVDTTVSPIDADRPW